MRRVVELSACENGLAQPRAFRFGDTDFAACNRQRHAAFAITEGGRCRADLDAVGRRELQRIAQQSEQNLGHTDQITYQCIRRTWIQIHIKARSGGIGLRAQGIHRPVTSPDSETGVSSDSRRAASIVEKSSTSSMIWSNADADERTVATMAR